MFGNQENWQELTLARCRQETQEIRLETDNDFGVKDDKNIASKIVLFSPAQCDSEAVEEECGGFLPPPQRFNWS